MKRWECLPSPALPSVCVFVCVSSELSSLDNLRRVSSSTTPPSVGLQLVKQRHLITAETTDLREREPTIVSELPGLCPLQPGNWLVCI